MKKRITSSVVPGDMPVANKGIKKGRSIWCTVSAALAAVLLTAMPIGCGDEESEKTSLPAQTTAAIAATASSTSTSTSTTAAADVTEELSVGDIIAFGSYEQDNDLTNGSEPIHWQVLDVCGDGSILVISRYALGNVNYNSVWTYATWQDCTLRSWMNDEFFNTAFTPEEQSCIKSVVLENPDNSKYGTYGGGDTEDKLFCLSLDEVYQYLGGVNDRKTIRTDYADGDDFWSWWLRTPGSSALNAVVVGYDGNIIHEGYAVNHENAFLRPAFYYDPEV